MNFEKETEKLLHFIDESPTAFQAVKNLGDMAEKAGFAELKETEEWSLEPGKSYYVKRNDSSIAAFSIPDREPEKIKGFHMVAAHSDSPSFKVKEKAEMTAENLYVRLNVEKYGGMILSTWLDRPLSVAGRVSLEKDGEVLTKLVNVDRDLLVIPNVAIHMNRDMNKGVEYNPQIDMLPLYGEKENGKGFLATVAEAAGVEEKDILSYDLFLYTRQKGTVIGGEGEYILAPRLDDLQCAYSAMRAVTKETPKDYINLCLVFDNEEVGSGTRQGADSTFLSDVLERIRESFGKSEGWLQAKIAGSFLLSADNAHAVHPGHPEKADPTNRPVLNGGVVLKFHGSQKYTTDAVSAAYVKLLGKQADVPVQTYTNRSDILGGSTLGNISTAHVSVPSADIGLPQLAMHSAVETAGRKDTAYAVALMREFYKK